MEESNTTINKDYKKPNISFFKKFIISIKDFEKYELMASESMANAFWYFVITMIIFSFIVSGLLTTKISLGYSDVEKENIQKYVKAVFNDEANTVVKNFFETVENKDAKTYAYIALVIFVVIFISFSIQILVDVFALSLVGYFISRVIRLPIKYSAIFKISIYAMTFPLILILMYVGVNIFKNFYVNNFNIMYTLISYIYIFTVLVIMRNELIKKKIIIQKIILDNQKADSEDCLKKTEPDDSTKDDNNSEDENTDNGDNKPQEEN